MGERGGREGELQFRTYGWRCDVLPSRNKQENAVTDEWEDGRREMRWDHRPARRMDMASVPFSDPIEVVVGGSYAREYGHHSFFFLFYIEN